MFGKAKIQNMKKKTEFHCLEMTKSRTQCLVNPKFRILMFGNEKIQNFNVWKSQNSEFQLMYGKAKIQSSNVWKSQNQEL